MKTIIALALVASMVINLSLEKRNNRQQYCYRITEATSASLFTRTQSFCQTTQALCVRSYEQARGRASEHTEISGCERTTRLFCVNVNNTRWCSSDLYQCSETAQYFGIDHGCR
jgi:hypothetical protein